MSDEKGKLYHNAKAAGRQNHKARQELTASDQMFDDGFKHRRRSTERC